MSDQLEQAARQALEAMRLNRSSAVVDAMQALEAALSQPEPEAVAVIGDTFSLLWASGDAISDIAKRHGLKVGSKLYAAPQPPAQTEPCDMGPICIVCEPRGPRGECPGAQAEARGDEPCKVTPYEPTSEMLTAARDIDPAIPLEHVRRLWWLMWKAAPQPQAEARGDEPTGAVINGRTLMDRLETGYSFDCEAGPLRLCSDWVGLRQCFEYLADYVFRPAPAAPQAGEASQPMSREGMSPLTREQVKAIVAEAGYDEDDVPLQSKADFINGIRHGEAAHGIGSGEGVA